MSWQASKWVFQVNRSVRGTALLVLAAIAEAVSEDGTGCTLAIRTIAERARTTERNVRRVISGPGGLVELGVLKVEFNAGKNGTNRIAILMNDERADQPARFTRQFNGRRGQDVPPDNVSVQEGMPADVPITDDNVSPGQRVPRTVGVANPDTLSPEPVLNRPTDSPSVELGEGTASNEAAATAPNKRGTRLPENWLPGPALITWAREKGMPDEYQRWATELFRDYFTAAAGRTATKRDWSAAWRVWLNRDFPKWQRDHPAASSGRLSSTRPDRAAAGLDIANELLNRGL